MRIYNSPLFLVKINTTKTQRETHIYNLDIYMLVDTQLKIKNLAIKVIQQKKTLKKGKIVIAEKRKNAQIRKIKKKYLHCERVGEEPLPKNNVKPLKTVLNIIIIIVQI